MRTLLYIVLISLGLASIATPVSALTVSPARVEITGDPGATLHGEIDVFNEQSDARTFFTSFENFEPSGDSGSPHFIGAEDGLATWIKTDDSVALDAGEHKIISFSITIPQDAAPGGYFAAVFFGSQAPGSQGSGDISIGGKIGVLILLRVSGDIAEGGGVLEFGTEDTQRFFTTLPVSFTYRVNNTGGDRIVPHGKVTIKNSLRLTSATLPANHSEGSVLPGSARKFALSWGEPVPKDQLGFFGMALRELRSFHFGWYTANLDLVWGDDASQTTNVSYSFFIVPWHLLLIVLGILTTLWFFGRIGLRRYNRLIIARAVQQINE